MVTSREGLQDEVASDTSQQRQSPETGFNVSQSNQAGSNVSTLEDKSSRELRSQSPDPGVLASPSDQEGMAHSLISVKISENLHPLRSPDNRDRTSISDQEKSYSALIPVEVVYSSQERESPDTVVNNPLRGDNNGSTPSNVPEKAPEDGYNWRKYGQKLVRGNECTRSYYKCTHPNCPAKRQVERSHAGQIIDTIYLGKHEHPKPQSSYQLPVGVVVPIQAIQPDEYASSIAEDTSDCRTSHHIEPLGTSQVSTVTASDFVEGAVSQSSGIRVEAEDNADPDSKRLKRDTRNVDETPLDKLNGEPRLVVQTLSEVDVVNDGYRWRKYGQKLVKGNPNPRSYYRCSSTRCPAKKHVERASHDPKVVVTTYEGKHDHNMPPTRTVTVNTLAADTNTTASKSESRSKAEENNTVGLEMVVHIGAN